MRDNNKINVENIKKFLLNKIFYYIFLKIYIYINIIY